MVSGGDPILNQHSYSEMLKWVFTPLHTLLKQMLFLFHTHLQYDLLLRHQSTMSRRRIKWTKQTVSVLAVLLVISHLATSQLHQSPCIADTSPLENKAAGNVMLPTAGSTTVIQCYVTYYWYYYCNTMLCYLLLVLLQQ